MSHSTTTPKVISTFHIEFFAAFKAVLDAHAIEMTKTQEAIASYKAMQQSGQLLDAMQAANDNDVDYLSDTLADDDTAPIEPIFSDDELAAVYPKITPADRQNLFIKNLADVLIQRMHSQDRFSEDDYAVGASKFVSWDIVYDGGADRFGLVTAAEKGYLSVFFLKSLSVYEFSELSKGFHKDTLLGQCIRTITVNEVTNFKTVLEAYHG